MCALFESDFFFSDCCCWFVSFLFIINRLCLCIWFSLLLLFKYIVVSVESRMSERVRGRTCAIAHLHTHTHSARRFYFVQYCRAAICKSSKPIHDKARASNVIMLILIFASRFVFFSSLSYYYFYTCCCCRCFLYFESYVCECVYFIVRSPSLPHTLCFFYIRTH